MQPRAASVNFPLVRCANYVGIVLALTLQRLYPNDFALEKVQRLLQHQPTIDAIKAGKTLAEIKQLRTIWTSSKNGGRNS